MSAFRLRRAPLPEVQSVLARERNAPFSYAPVGSAVTPPGWFDNRGTVELGRGADVFARARDALRRWRMFDLGWTEAIPERENAIEPGMTVAVLARTLGLHTLLLARVVAVQDEPRRFAFSYGTLPHHVERGEETFAVTWHDDDRVTYSVWSYSRPGHFLVRLGAPFARRLQRRFVRDSCARMRKLAGVDALQGKDALPPAAGYFST